MITKLAARWGDEIKKGKIHSYTGELLHCYGMLDGEETTVGRHVAGYLPHLKLVPRIDAMMQFLPVQKSRFSQS